MHAQQIPFGFQMQPAQVELTAPHVEVIPGATAARLEQARQLAAARSWDEAVDIYRELGADKSDRVVAIDGNRYLSLRNYCHLQIARLPAEGLAAYRRRVDASAEQLYRDGLAKRDEGLLRRVVDEWFCSSWGDDALMALGELALERGDYAAARRSWEQISPLLCAPNGSPSVVGAARYRPEHKVAGGGAALADSRKAGGLACIPGYAARPGRSSRPTRAGFHSCGGT